MRVYVKDGEIIVCVDGVRTSEDLTGICSLDDVLTDLLARGHNGIYSERQQQRITQRVRALLRLWINEEVQDVDFRDEPKKTKR